MTDYPIVQTERLTHRYGLRVALCELTLSVYPGEAFGLLGPNGSGKTTLFRILSTLIPPADGRAAILGYDLATQRKQVRRHIGVVFQSPGLDRQLTAEENLIHHGHLYGLHGPELRTRARDLLARVGLLDRARERIGAFSGGMRRRVELAKGLLNRPKLLLLDEPSTGLDPVARMELWRYLEEVRDSDGVTVLLTTHLMDEADCCDRAAILDQGRMVACDAPAALKERVRGDVITLTSHDPAGAGRMLRQKLGIEAESAGQVLRFQRPRGHEFVPSLIEALSGLVESVSVGRPTLQDVFFHTTGHDFDEQ